MPVDQCNCDAYMAMEEGTYVLYRVKMVVHMQTWSHYCFACMVNPLLQ